MIWVGHRGSDRWLLPTVDVVACYGSGEGNVEEVLAGIRAEGTTSEDQPRPAAVRQARYTYYREDLSVTTDRRRRQLISELASKRYLASSAVQASGVVGQGFRLQGRRAYSDIVRAVGSPFYLKADRSVSGKAVFRIRSEQELDQVSAAYAVEELTAWRELQGESINCHVLVDKAGSLKPVLCSLQLFQQNAYGAPVLFAGSDFRWSARRNPATIHSVERVLQTFGSLVHRAGFAGVFGVDLVVGREGAHVIDLNPRYQGSSLPVSIAFECMGIGTLGSVGEALADGEALGDLLNGSDVGLAWPTGLPAPVQVSIVNHSRTDVTAESGTASDLIVDSAGGVSTYEGEVGAFLPDLGGHEPVMLATDVPRAGIPVAVGANVARLIIYNGGTSVDMDLWKRRLLAAVGLPPLDAASGVPAPVDRGDNRRS